MSDARPPGRRAGDDESGRHRRAIYYRLPRRRRAWLGFVGWTVWALVGLATAVGVASYSFLDETLAKASPKTPRVEAAIRATAPRASGEPINLLLIGSDTRADEGEGGGRSDTLILVRMDPKQDFISMLSFPRDLYISIPGYGLGRINEAYNVGGPAKTIETVRALTGQPVNAYINVDFDGFRDLVDEVGGVYLDVDRRYFNDNSGSEKYEMIDLQAGYQRLLGEDALDYVRYRHTDSDFVRNARQQQFLSELKRQTGRFGNLLQVRDFGRIFARNIETSIREVSTLLQVVELAVSIDDERIARTKIDGYGDMIGGASVVVTSQAEIDTKVAEWLEPEFELGEPEEPVAPAEVSVRVVNGGGRALAAGDMAQLLAGAGFAAFDAGNASVTGATQTAILYAAEARDAGRAVQAKIGPEATLAIGEPAELGGADVAVVVGSDFTGALYTPPAVDPTDEPAPTATNIDTLSLVDVFRRVEAATDLTTMVPLKLPTGSRARIVRPYRVNTGGTGPEALKVVFEVGFAKYFGITQTSMADPPILDGRTGVETSGGREYSTYYDGKNLQRLAWRKDGMSYWISNSLDYTLTDQQMYAIAKSSRLLSRAKLPKGATPTEIDVQTDASTS